MKKVNGIVTFLKMVIKYGAYFVVVLDIFQFAIDRLSEVNPDKLDKDVKELSE